MCFTPTPIFGCGETKTKRREVNFHYSFGLINNVWDEILTRGLYFKFKRIDDGLIPSNRFHQVIKSG